MGLARIIFAWTGRLQPKRGLFRANLSLCGLQIQTTLIIRSATLKERVRGEACRGVTIPWKRLKVGCDPLQQLSRKKVFSVCESTIYDSREKARCSWKSLMHKSGNNSPLRWALSIEAGDKGDKRILIGIPNISAAAAQRVWPQSRLTHERIQRNRTVCFYKGQSIR